MVRPIMKDVSFLNQKSELATEADRQVAEDLLDTLNAYEADRGLSFEGSTGRKGRNEGRADRCC